MENDRNIGRWCIVCSKRGVVILEGSTGPRAWFASAGSRGRVVAWSRLPAIAMRLLHLATNIIRHPGHRRCPQHLEIVATRLPLDCSRSSTALKILSTVAYSVHITNDSSNGRILSTNTPKAYTLPTVLHAPIICCCLFASPHSAVSEHSSRCSSPFRETRCQALLIPGGADVEVDVASWSA